MKESKAVQTSFVLINQQYSLSVIRFFSLEFLMFLDKMLTFLEVLL